jgi:hypothetical protein
LRVWRSSAAANLLQSDRASWIVGRHTERPRCAFETPQPQAFTELSRQAGAPQASAEWTAIVLPAIKALGGKDIADRLRLNYRTVKSWISGRKRPTDVAAVKRAAIRLAVEHGLFSDGEIAKNNDTTILEQVPDRVQRASEFLTHVTAMFLMLHGGTRPLARAIANSAKPAVETVRRWRNIGTAPKTLADNTAYLRRMATFARAGLRKIGRRVNAERGPGGDRVIIIAYLWGISGGPIKLKPDEALAYTRLFFSASPDWNEAPMLDSGFGPAW